MLNSSKNEQKGTDEPSLTTYLYHSRKDFGDNFVNKRQLNLVERIKSWRVHANNHYDVTIE